MSISRDVLPVPLWGEGGVIRSWVVVSADDYDRVIERRWNLSSYGYAVTQIDKRKTMMHRLILGLEHGDRREVDHINLCRVDNRRENLRICTRRQQLQNVPARGGSSRYRGVAFHKGTGKWRAQVQQDGKTVYLGVFRTEAQAAAEAAAFRALHMQNSPEAALVPVWFDIHWRLVPLHNRDGTVRAFAVVDEEDYGKVVRYFWSWSHGYARRRGKGGVTVKMHREVMGLAPYAGSDVDHLNGDRLDNRKGNLRVCTRSENLRSGFRRRAA